MPSVSLLKEVDTTSLDLNLDIVWAPLLTKDSLFFNFVFSCSITSSILIKKNKNKININKNI